MWRAWWLLVWCGLVGCRDRGAEAWARAQYEHRHLLAQSVAPEDARFDAVLAELAQVPASSRHAPEARRLEASIRAGRAATVRTPLALGEKADRDPRLAAQLAACARLAQLTGADGGVHHEALVALEACRKQAELLELKLSHGDDGEPDAGDSADSRR